MFGGFAPLPLRLGGSATEGWPATQHARAVADLSACVRSCPFAWVTFVRNLEEDSVHVNAYNGMNGDGIAFAPLITTLSVFEVSVNWNTCPSDAYERAEPLAIRSAKATVQGNVFAHALCDWTMGESSVIVRCYDGDGAPSWGNIGAITLRVT